MRGDMQQNFRMVLISTYELGRQPFGLASPAAWLRQEGAEVRCLDLSQQHLDEEAIRAAELIAFYLPMHTATRIAVRVLKKVRELNPSVHLCAYGLYAPMNAELLRNLGVRTILGGEFEQGLLDLSRRLRARVEEASEQSQVEPEISLARQKFLVPDRTGLPLLKNYARLALPDGSERVVGYTEASRGCKHLCRHCPIVPGYNGRFRIVQREVVLEDVRQQVAAGAQHITFGDPDFFNGIGHSLELVQALHKEHPGVSYDVTIKVEHLLKHASHLPTLRDTGCAFVTTAAESLDDEVLAILDKGHSRADFFEVVRLLHEIGLGLTPTFVPFNPWTTLESYEDLLVNLAKLGLVVLVAPVQLSIRLLIPAGSRLLELSEVRERIGEFDETALSYRWANPDPRVDELQREIEELVQFAPAEICERKATFEDMWRRLQRALHEKMEFLKALPWGPPAQSKPIPYLTEPWFC